MSASVAGLFICARSVPVVAVLEFADLRVNPALDARGRGTRIVRRAACRAVAEGSNRVHGRRRKAVARGVPSRVKVPAEVRGSEEEEQDYDEDEPAVHFGGGGALWYFGGLLGSHVRWSTDVIASARMPWVRCCAEGGMACGWGRVLAAKVSLRLKLIQ